MSMHETHERVDGLEASNGNLVSIQYPSFKHAGIYVLDRISS